MQVVDTPKHFDAFVRFHTENPQVYRELVRLARQAYERGYRRLGIELLLNLVRWNEMMSTRPDAMGFKINNNFKAYYVRMIQHYEPELGSMFTTRRSYADGMG